MKRLLILGVGSALMFTMGGIGSAQADTSGAIHKSTSAMALEVQQVSVGGSRCAGCHRAHTAKAEKLLKMAQPALCYTCHGSLGSVLDVVDGVDSNTTNALRGGGFAFALINGGAASKTMPAVLDQYSHPASEMVPVLTAGLPVTSRHQIDGVTSGTMWGNGAISNTITGGLDAGKSGVTLECASCHDPHGNGNYRILKPIPNDAATKAAPAVPAVAAVAAVAEVSHLDQYGTKVITTPGVAAVAAVAAVPAVAAVVVLPVAIPDALTKVYTTSNYWAVADRNVPTLHAAADTIVAGVRVAGAVGTLPIDTTLTTTGTTDGYITNVAAWCSTCHTRYLAPSGSYKTPLTDATTGKIDATFTYRHRSDRADKDGKNVPNCIQCHVSHGTNVSMLPASGSSFTTPDGGLVGAKGASGDHTVVGLPVGGTAEGTSRLLRVDNRGTCEMCHNV